MRPRGAPLLWDPGTANPKQREFFRSRALYTAYGGAKGGGSALTPKAWELLERYRAFEWETRQAAQRAFAAHFNDFP